MLLLRPSNQRPRTGSHSLDAAAYRIEPTVHEYKVRWGLHSSVYYSGVVPYNSQKWHPCLLFQTASSTLVRLPFMLPRLNYRTERKTPLSGPYLGFFVCGGKLGFREISDQYSYKKQPSKIRHYVRKKTFSFPGGGNCPLRPPAMYGPGCLLWGSQAWTWWRFKRGRPRN